MMKDREIYSPLPVPPPQGGRGPLFNIGPAISYPLSPCGRGLGRGVFILLSFLFLIPKAHAAVYLTQDEALKIAFPGETAVERKTVFLTDEQIDEIEAAARTKMESAIETYYVGRADGRITGYAFFDSHVVRSMPETIMVALHPDGKLNFVEVLAFHEPGEYRPSPKWLELFEGKQLDKGLWVNRDVRNITGSTLTTRALTAGVRRILATFQVAVREE